MEPPAPPRQAASFPTLAVLDPTTPHTFTKPSKRINEGPDVETFLVSKAYRDIGIFIMQLNRAMCPRKMPGPARRETARTWTLDTLAESSLPASVKGLRGLLKKVEAMVEEAPPDPGPRRFGNVSFRKWHKLVEERTDALMDEFIDEAVLSFPSSSSSFDGEGGKAGPRDELRAYFLGGFGSEQRLDYGTGHELNFLAFLGCLWKLGAFKDGKEGGDLERSLVLGVLEPYLHVIRRVILTYTLEPAGSHGVWGLDDHSFLPYIFGSAQLTRPITDDEPMPLEGSVRGAPKTGDVVKSDVVERERERNLYFSAIGFINDVKKGPFWEHSPILFDVSGVQDGWGKINKGMIKMFNAEVLSKFPVVQHFPFGSLFSFDEDPEASIPIQSVHMANQPTAMACPLPSGGMGLTGAPWAQAGGMPRPTGPGIPYSRIPPGGVTQRPGPARGPPRGGPA
ncbi:Serine/threonine-protein phosphatase 2A activator 1 [Scedosporium apiospermum]|uniref:Serine/threonine-protein phosphatase 2A activator n=1 Tax=Pseudallescheria apiosperma TaxID=563466 RepID=A0A084FYC0_PSEDA|nr:Serine/threonine-protein phosphatase 2A activator 1 [Scedosporium apiospermum]KEZ40082.1 Serine/threonine-protein phosphatase 2A activator 1 [Scedosporium apiospermum]